MVELKSSKFPSREERAETGRKARAIFEPLRAELEREHWGEYMSINVDNGDYVIEKENLASAKKLRKKYPGTLPFTIRIGYKSVFHFGGSGLTDGMRK